MSEGRHAIGSGLNNGAALNAGDSLWQACIDQLAQELPEQQFNTWIKPIVAQVSDDFSKVTLFVANRFKLDWVRARSYLIKGVERFSYPFIRLRIITQIII